MRKHFVHFARWAVLAVATFLLFAHAIFIPHIAHAAPVPEPGNYMFRLTLSRTVNNAQITATPLSGDQQTFNDFVLEDGSYYSRESVFLQSGASGGGCRTGVDFNRFEIVVRSGTSVWGRSTIDACANADGQRYINASLTVVPPSQSNQVGSINIRLNTPAGAPEGQTFPGGRWELTGPNDFSQEGTVSGGRVQVGNLQPGTYRLVAVYTQEGDTSQLPGGVRLTYTIDETIEVVAGQTVTESFTAEATDPNGDPPEETEGEADEEAKSCEDNGGDLGWIMCPIIRAADAGLTQIDKYIDSLLRIDRNYYDDNGIKRAQS